MGISWTSKNWVKKHDFPWGSKEFHGIFYGNTSGEEPYEHMDIIYWLLYVIIIWYSYIYTHVYSIYIYIIIYTGSYHIGCTSSCLFQLPAHGFLRLPDME